MSTNRPRPVSDLAIPPGEVLAEEIAVRGISQAEFGSLLGMSALEFQDLIRGDAAVTIEIATKLFQLLGIEASYWMTLEASYAKFVRNL